MSSPRLNSQIFCGQRGETIETPSAISHPGLCSHHCTLPNPTHHHWFSPCCTLYSPQSFKLCHLLGGPFSIPGYNFLFSPVPDFPYTPGFCSLPPPLTFSSTS